MGESNGSGGTRLQVITALISAVGTIAVAWVGILPALRKDDQTRIGKLEKDILALNEQLGKYAPVGESEQTWVVKGSVVEELDTGQRPITNAFVALLPLGNEKLLTTSDDQGMFVLSGVPSGHYMFMVSPDDHLIDRGTIEAGARTEDDMKFETTLVQYQIAPERNE